MSLPPRARRGVAFWLGAVLLLLFVSRFANLQYMGFHHDESIHCLFGWRIAHQNSVRTYTYNPTYHGPFLYHFGGLTYKFLPDTNYTGRVPFALMGTIAVLLFLLWRRTFGMGVVLLVTTLLTLSAIVDYFSRFARADVYMTAWLTGTIVTGTRYLRTRQVRFLTAAAWFIALSYCTKENSYINNFALCSFLVLWAVVRFLRGPSEALRDVFVRYLPLARLLVLYGCFSVFTFAYVAIDSRVGPQTDLKTGVERMLSQATAVRERGDASVFANESGFFRAKGREAVRTFYFRTAFATTLLILVLVEVLSFLVDRDMRRPFWRLPLLALLAVGFYGLLALIFVRLISWTRTAPDPVRIIPALFTRELIRFVVLSVGALSAGALAFAVPDAIRFAFSPRGSGTMQRHGRWRGRILTAVRDAFKIWIERLLGFWGFALQVMGAVFVFILLFSSVGANLRGGPVAGLYDYLAYWVKHQTGDYRIWGVWWYYLPRLALFDLLPIVLILFMLVLFACRAVARIARPSASAPPADASGPDIGPSIWMPLPLPLLVFAGYLTAFLSIVYALLNEKVPWLTTYQSFALNLFAALIASHWIATSRRDLGARAGQRLSPLRLGLRILVGVFFGLLVCFAIGQHVTTVFVRPDYPEELLTFTQTTHDFAVEMRRIDRLRKEKAAEDKQLAVAVKGAAEWPCWWYFRHDKASWKTISLWGDIQVADDTPDNRRRVEAAQDYVWQAHPLALRGWWHWHGNPEGLPGDRQFIPNVRAFLRNTPNDMRSKFPRDSIPPKDEYPIGFRDQVLRYIFSRDLWYPPAGHKIVIWEKTDQKVDPEIANISLKGAEKPPRPARLQGLLGAGPPDPLRFRNPRGVAMTPDGNVAVVDSSNGRVVVFSQQGTPVLEFGQDTLGLDQSGAGGIAVDAQGNFLVADTWNHALRLFGPDGQLLKTVESGIAEGNAVRFFGPRGVAIAPDGRIYVTDTGKRAVRVFGPDLRPLFSWGEAGSAPGDFLEPVGIAIDGKGRVYVADAGNGRIQRFDSEGRFDTQYLTVRLKPSEVVSAEPYLAVLADGRIAMTLSTTHSIWAFDPETRQTFLYDLEAPYDEAEYIGIAQDKTGSVWVAERHESRILRLDIPIPDR
ncbi:hypothetical protein JW916_08375 [Candidatus Sumerlaeota bacterium]|nr:hypothetical protein [Candidatus Sumerlaeota bacterium]